MRFKYPKLALLALIFLTSYLVMTADLFRPARSWIVDLGYAGILVAGILYSYGLTAAPATAALLILSKSQGLVFAALLGGIGAAFGDFAIFKVIRLSFMDEINELKGEKFVAALNSAIPKPIGKYVLPVVAGFIILSPFPDEIGVSLLASSEKISGAHLVVISYVLNTLGIFLILALGQTVLA